MNEELTYEERRQQANNDRDRRIRDIVSNLMDELNKMGSEEEVGKCFVNAISQTHRTLQQNFFRDILLVCIKNFARRYDDGQYDLRNEESCKIAKKLMPIIKDAGLPFI